MHAQSRVLEEMFTRAGIPYRIFGGTRFYDRKEVRDALAYLRVLVNPADDVSLLRIINTPKRAIGDTTVEALQDCARDEGLPLFSVLCDPPESLSSRPRKCVGEFALLLMRLTAMKDTMTLSETVEAVLRETGLRAQYEIENSDEAQTRLENLMEFAGAAKEFENQSEDKTLEAFLENVALVTDLDRQEDAPQYVTLMTLHSAKGLEYDAVFISGMEEGIFPSMRSVMEEKRLEEERRLCYVGITRAKKRLFLSFARRRLLFNQITHSAPSPFLKEIPQRLIQDEWASAERQPFGNMPRPAAPQPKRQETGFGAPGMAAGSRGVLNIPGVTKGFVASPARAFAAKATVFSPGDKVMHRKFGEGTVKEVRGSGAEERIVISFPAYGTKEFSLSIAPIVKIDE